MEAILAEQTRAFIYAVVLGAGLGFLYDALHFIRLMLGENLAVTCVLDLLFCLACGGAFFAFTLIFLHGTARGYCAIGCLLGGMLYFFSVSPFLMAAIKPIALAMRGVPTKIRLIFKKLSEFTIKK